MGKPKRRKCVCAGQAERGRSVHLPRVGIVHFAPSRESCEPFCAYYGPRGETCPLTTGLLEVRTLPTLPPVRFMACPAHRQAVEQRVQQFLDEIARLPAVKT